MQTQTSLAGWVEAKDHPDFPINPTFSGLPLAGGGNSGTYLFTYTCPFPPQHTLAPLLHTLPNTLHMLPLP